MTKKPMRSPSKAAGDAAFSLVDLLAVVAVTLLLALLLTPAQARTRATDLAFQCRNNLRQLIHGWRMYAEDNSGVLVPSGGGGLNCFEWVGGFLNYYSNNPDNTNINYLAGGALGPYTPEPAVYKCPADQSMAREGTNVFPRVRTYSMSQAFSLQNEGHLEDTKPNYYRHYQTLADMVRPAPANLWVLLDEDPDSVNDAAFGVKMDPHGGIWQDLPTTLHEGACGFAFADGHCETHQWKDGRTLSLYVKYSPGIYGIYQPNNPDIMWVQDRTTAPK